MIEGMNPAAIFLAGALLLPFFQEWPRKILILSIPLFGLVQLFTLEAGNAGFIDFLDYRLVTYLEQRLAR